MLHLLSFLHAHIHIARDVKLSLHTLPFKGPGVSLMHIADFVLYNVCLTIILIASGPVTWSQGSIDRGQRNSYRSSNVLAKWPERLTVSSTACTRVAIQVWRKCCRSCANFLEPQQCVGSGHGNYHHTSRAVRVVHPNILWVGNGLWQHRLCQSFAVAVDL